MTQETERINMTLYIDSRDNLDPDELQQLARRLLRSLDSLDVESVSLLREQSTLSGTKGGVDPITLGALSVVVLQVALPKVLEFLQAWTLRNKDYTLKIKVQQGDRIIEAEYPAKMSPEEVKRHFQVITNALAD
jgi:hypothetical protein